MKRYSLWVAIWIAATLICAATWAGALPTDTDPLFQELEAMYASSSTPFPVEELLMKMPGEKPHLSGCKVATPSYDYSEGGMVFIQYRFVFDSTASLFGRPNYVSGVLAMPSTNMLYYVDINNQTFRNGVLSFSQEDCTNRPMPECSDGTTDAQLIANGTCALSADEHSYSVKSSCNSGTLAYQWDIKASGRSMIARVLEPRDSDTPVEFIYCWP